MKRIKQNKKGFTLLEVLIAMAISSLLLTGLVGMVLPANDMLHTTSCLQEQREIIRIVNYGISERVRYANDVIIVQNSTDIPLSGAEFNDYKCIIIDNQADDYSSDYRGTTVKGRVFVKPTLGSGEITPMISLDSYSRYSCDIVADKEGYSLVLNFHLYRNMKNGTVEDSFTVKNTTQLKNTTDAIETPGSIRVIDEKNMVAGDEITGLTLKGPGENTYILYK